MNNSKHIISVTKNFHNLYESYNSGKYTTYVLEGGSRSGKTWAIIQFIIFLIINHPFTKTTIDDSGNITKQVVPPLDIVIARAAATWLSKSVYKDFMDILLSMDLMRFCKVKATTKEINIFNARIVFLGLDTPQRLHGIACDIFWLNEAVEAKKADYDQLNMRCRQFAILDYNPSPYKHWIYSTVLKSPKTFYVHSTMLDNCYVTYEQRKKILAYEPTPDNIMAGTADLRQWTIYGLGKRAKQDEVIFDIEFNYTPEMPDYVRQYVGIDWGYANDPTAITKVGFTPYNNTLFIEKIAYKTGMGIDETVRIIRTLKDLPMVADSSDPLMIDEISERSGCYIEGANKPSGSVNAGIRKMQQMKFVFVGDSEEIENEFREYKWKKNKQGEILDEPIDRFNHAIDSIRYVVLDFIIGQPYEKPTQSQLNYYL